MNTQHATRSAPNNTLTLLRYLASQFEGVSLSVRTPYATRNTPPAFCWTVHWAGHSVSATEAQAAVTQALHRIHGAHTKTLKQWRHEEAARLGLHPATIWERLRKHPQRYYPHIKLKQINARLILVIETPLRPSRPLREESRQRDCECHMARLPDHNPFNHTVGKRICPNCLTPIITMPHAKDAKDAKET